jgi:hypothetical protein
MEKIIHAMSIAATPIATVTTNIPCKLLLVITLAVSLFYLPYQYGTQRTGSKLTLAISIMPPHIRQNEKINSEGGRDECPEMGGEMCSRR